MMRSSELKSFIYGTLLGDSSISKSNENTLSCGQIDKELIDYKASVYKKHLPGVKLKKYNENWKGRDGWKRQPLFRLTARHIHFKKIRERFYDENGVKRVNMKILKALKPNGLAVWFADDGTSNLIGKNNLLSGKTSRLTDRRVELCTDGFLKEDVEIIKTYFENLLGGRIIVVNRDYKDKNNQNPTGYRIRFTTVPAQKLISIIYKEFLKNYPSLLYKLDMGYRDIILEDRNYVTEEYEKAYMEISAHHDFIDRLNREDMV